MRRLTVVVVLLLVSGACSAEPIPPPITREGPEPPATTTPAPTAPTAPPPTVTPTTPIGVVDDRADERATMVENQIVARDITDPLVIEAMGTVPRHRFVPESWVDEAYGDHPLPIGYGQTISQPYIVALMSEALEVEPGDKVLEIGTGSGYQAAILAAMGLEVYTIEIVTELGVRAEATLDELGYDVAVAYGDGYFGWEDEAPFDAIIVTAAPDHVPQPLVEQLTVGGVMVIPVGPIGAVQTLWRFTADESGEVLAESLGWVSFVPFTRADD